MVNQKLNDTQVLVGQPIHYPSELMIFMSEIFDLEKSIKKAYLACIQFADPKLSLKILIGLEVSGDVEKIISNILIHMQDHQIKQFEFADATQGQFQNYFMKIKPFYSRKI